MTQFAASHAYSIGDIVRQRGNSATKTITALTSVTTTATATVTGHGYITGQSVLISGATQGNYNKQTTITVTDANTFTYTITATTSPATGSPVVFDSQVLTSLRCFRCTTAGTSAATEPAWTLTKSATTTSSGATFTEVTGNSTFNWSAPYPTISFFNSNWAVAGDTLYVSSDHAETFSSTYSLNVNLTNMMIISVNRAGSVPPVAADILSGASVTTTGASAITISGVEVVIQGITFNCGTGNNSIILTTTGINGSPYFKNCNFNMVATSTSCSIAPTGSSGYTIWDNCTVQFANASQGLACGSGRFLWLNTPTAIQGATLPTSLITGTNPVFEFTLQGVDLSAMTSGTICDLTGSTPTRISLFDCKLGSGVTVASATAASGSIVDLKNCDSGATGYRNEYYAFAATQTTETTITRTGGATDGVQLVSWKVVTTSTPQTSGTYLSPIYKWNTTQSSVTATVEVFSNVTLNNNDIWIELMYLGSSLTPQGSTVSTGLATPLSTSTPVTSSTAVWANMFFNPADESNITLSNGNLTATKSATSSGAVRSYSYTSSGLLYFEITNVTTSTTWRCGLSTASYLVTGALGATTASLGYTPNTGVITINNATITTIQTATSGDVIGIAVDFTHSKIWIRKNAGNWNNAAIGSQDPASNIGGASISTLAAGPYYVTFADASNGTASATVNFGNTSFNTAAPSGFSAWNTVLCGQRMQTTAFVPAMTGYVRAFVKVAKASATIYVDPLITIA